MTNASQTTNPARPAATRGPPFAMVMVNTAEVSRQAAAGEQRL
jgi:hypothetical protein